MTGFEWLSRRQCEPEVMDDPGLDPQRHVAALRGLTRLNGLSASGRIVWASIARLARQRNMDRLRVLDVASGAGDIPLGLWQTARRANLKLDLHGVDISPQAIDFARNRAQAHRAPITFSQLDVLNQSLPQGFDVVISSLFFHHLADTQAVSLLRSMSNAAKQLVLINDLRRNLLGWLLAHAAARFFTRSDVVHTDAPISVKAAFTPAEFRNLATSAGLNDATVCRRWPCRMLLMWQRPPASNASQTL